MQRCGKAVCLYLESQKENTKAFFKGELLRPLATTDDDDSNPRMFIFLTCLAIFGVGAGLLIHRQIDSLDYLDGQYQSFDYLYVNGSYAFRDGYTDLSQQIPLAAQVGRDINSLAIQAPDKLDVNMDCDPKLSMEQFQIDVRALQLYIYDYHQKIYNLPSINTTAQLCKYTFDTVPSSYWNSSTTYTPVMQSYCETFTDLAVNYFPAVIYNIGWRNPSALFPFLLAQTTSTCSSFFQERLLEVESMYAAKSIDATARVSALVGLALARQSVGCLPLINPVPITASTMSYYRLLNYFVIMQPNAGALSGQYTNLRSLIPTGIPQIWESSTTKDNWIYQRYGQYLQQGGCLSGDSTGPSPIVYYTYKPTGSDIFVVLAPQLQTLWLTVLASFTTLYGLYLFKQDKEAEQEAPNAPRESSAAAKRNSTRSEPMFRGPSSDIDMPVSSSPHHSL